MEKGGLVDPNTNATLKAMGELSDCPMISMRMLAGMRMKVLCKDTPLLQQPTAMSSRTVTLSYLDMPSSQMPLVPLGVVLRDL